MVVISPNLVPKYKVAKGCEYAVNLAIIYDTH
jgi:hypothetical protein